MPRIKARTIKEHVDLRRNAILDAGFTLLQTRGYADFGLEDVAAQAGLSRSSLYQYYRDKDELLLEAVWPHAERRLRERQVQILAITHPGERFAAWSRTTIELYAGADYDVFDLMAQIPLAQSELKRRITRLMRPLIVQLRADFAELTAGSGMTPAMWVEIFDTCHRDVGRYGRDRGRSREVAEELTRVSRALLITRFTEDGRIAGHAPERLPPVGHAGFSRSSVATDAVER